MSGYRQIILHAGLSKTGSTSIQAACHRDRAGLAHRGITYPQFTFDDQAFANHSVALISAIAAEAGKYGLGLRRQFGVEAPRVAGCCREQLDELLTGPGGEILLLSSERVAGLDERDMRSLRDTLAPHTRQLRVMAFIRSPVSALESILQERVKAGSRVQPADLVGRVRRRYEALHHCFGDTLELFNYHEMLGRPGGTVAAFMALLGVPQEDLSGLTFPGENPRMSMEAFQLMDAINRRYPKNLQPEHGVARRPGDLNALLALPGQPFQLPGFAGSPLEEATAQEARWLESRLGFRFPPAERVELLPPWQRATLVALEQVLREFEDESMRQLLAQAVAAQARALQHDRPETARELQVIAGRVARETL